MPVSAPGMVLIQKGHDGQHRRGEGDVVDEGRGDGADPEDHHRGHRQIARGDIPHPVGDDLDQAGVLGRRQSP